MWQATDHEPLELQGQAVLIIGCGAVGSAFGRAFARLGADLELWSRDGARAASLAESLGVRASTDLDAAFSKASLVCLAISDDALEDFVTSLGGGPASSGFVFHTNGSVGHEVLAPLAALGWQTGKLHPLRAFPQAASLPQSCLAHTWFVAGSEPDATLVCSALVRSLESYELRLSPGGSLPLHAAASLLSGGLVALFDHAIEVAQNASQDPQAARDALLALLNSSVSNLLENPPAQALSGPIARGADQLVARQLETLDGDACELYRLLGRRMLALSQSCAPMDPASLERLRKLLG